jgi:hypothetical protein
MLYEQILELATSICFYSRKLLANFAYRHREIYQRLLFSVRRASMRSQWYPLYTLPHTCSQGSCRPKGSRYLPCFRSFGTWTNNEDNELRSIFKTSLFDREQLMQGTSLSPSLGYLVVHAICSRICWSVWGPIPKTGLKPAARMRHATASPGGASTRRQGLSSRGSILETGR